MTVEYRAIDAPVDFYTLEAIKDLYANAGWLAYLNDDSALERALNTSLYLLGAYAVDASGTENQSEHLIGFARCVGDGEHVVLLQDLLVHSAWQRHGVGTHLMNACWERYDHVRSRMLVTDAHDSRANSFYRAQGLQTLEDQALIAYRLP